MRKPIVTSQSRLKMRVTKTVEFYETISLEDVDINTIDDNDDPAIAIPRRVDQLAALLNCSEEEAQQILFAYNDR